LTSPGRDFEVGAPEPTCITTYAKTKEKRNQSKIQITGPCDEREGRNCKKPQEDLNSEISGLNLVNS
jgi:hypothetical protein